jgi:hypothetical protein
MAAGWMLAIDFGTSFTTAAIDDGHGPRLVEVDRSWRVPSAVLRSPDGSLVAGSAAVNQAALRPDAYEPSPKRNVGQGTVLLGEGAVDVVDAIAAVLEPLVSEAVRLRGGTPPSRVCLTHPANWGAARLGVLVEAARRAGLTDPVLLAEPVAAAAWYATGEEIPAGADVAVYDLGGGTFDAAVVTSAGDGTFEVAGPPDGIDPLGGVDIDAALLAWIGSTRIGPADPEAWTSLMMPADAHWRSARRKLLDEVTKAKEALSRHSQYVLYVPEVNLDVTVTREELERLIADDVDRTVSVLASTIDRAGRRPADLHAVFLVGGSSRIPAVAERVWERLEVRPRTLDEPKQVVALGALVHLARGGEVDPAGVASDDRGATGGPPGDPADVEPPGPAVAPDPRAPVLEVLARTVRARGVPAPTDAESLHRALVESLGSDGDLYALEVWVLAESARHGVPGALAAGQPPAALAPWLAPRLGSAAGGASWAVETWAQVLAPEPADAVPAAEPAVDALDGEVRSAAAASVGTATATATVSRSPFVPPDRVPGAGGPRVADPPPDGSVPSTGGGPAGTSPDGHRTTALRTPPAPGDPWRQGSGALRKRRAALVEWFAANVSEDPPVAAVALAQGSLWVMVVAALAATGLVLSSVTGAPVLAPGALILAPLVLFAVRRYGLVLTASEVVVVRLSPLSKPKAVDGRWPLGRVPAELQGGFRFQRLLARPDGRERQFYVPTGERTHGEIVAAALGAEVPPPAAPPTRRLIAAGVIVAGLVVQGAMAAALSGDGLSIGGGGSGDGVAPTVLEGIGLDADDCRRTTSGAAVSAGAAAVSTCDLDTGTVEVQSWASAADLDEWFDESLAAAGEGVEETTWEREWGIPTGRYVEGTVGDETLLWWEYEDELVTVELRDSDPVRAGRSWVSSFTDTASPPDQDVIASFFPVVSVAPDECHVLPAAFLADSGLRGGWRCEVRWADTPIRVDYASFDGDPSDSLLAPLRDRANAVDYDGRWTQEGVDDDFGDYLSYEKRDAEEAGIAWTYDGYPYTGHARADDADALLSWWEERGSGFTAPD